jgi:hypothetical protein
MSATTTTGTTSTTAATGTASPAAATSAAAPSAAATAAATTTTAVAAAPTTDSVFSPTLEPAESAARSDFRDITVAGRRVRIVADPSSPTIAVYEAPDPCVMVFLGRVVAADAKLPKLLLAKDNTDWATPQPVRDTIRAAALGFWRQVRADYFRSIGTLGLPVLSRPRIAGRTLCLALVFSQPRIRVTNAILKPFYVGTVVDLDGGHPRFLPGPSHLYWVRTGDRIRRIVDDARIAYAQRGP